MRTMDQLWRRAVRQSYLGLWWLVHELNYCCLWLTGAPHRSQAQGCPVHIQTVCARHKVIDTALPSKFDFISYHSTFQPLKYLETPTVTLYWLDDRNAYFVETSLKDVYSLSESPFAYLTLYRYAEKLIIVSLSDFIEFSQIIGDPTSKVFLVSNTGRCGSTLLCQMLDATKHCVVISENDALVSHFSTKTSLVLDTSTMLQAIFRVICKVSQNTNRPIIIVPHSGLSLRVEGIASKIPYVKHLIMHRKGVDTATSVLKVYTAISLHKNNLSEIEFVKMLKEKVALDSVALEYVTTPFSFCCWYWALHMHSLLQFRQNFTDYSIPMLRYEDLISDPRQVFGNLLKYFDMPIDLVDVGVGAMNRDSQTNTFMSACNMSSICKTFAVRCDVRMYEGDIKEQCDNICDELRVPHLDKII